MIKGFIVAGVQVAIVLSVGAKFSMDRATLPRVWVQAAPFDPNMPIRGRYVSLTVAVEPRGFGGGVLYGASRLTVEGGTLVATQSADGDVMVMMNSGRARLSAPIVYFIPEHVPDPSIRPAGEELWVEVSVPKKGPPRPIRLGVKKNGVLTPFEFN
jgi:hypothetical protein